MPSNEDVEVMTARTNLLEFWHWPMPRAVGRRLDLNICVFVALTRGRDDVIGLCVSYRRQRDHSSEGQLRNYVPVRNL